MTDRAQDLTPPTRASQMFAACERIGAFVQHSIAEPSERPEVRQPLVLTATACASPWEALAMAIDQMMPLALTSNKSQTQQARRHIYCWVPPFQQVRQFIKLECSGLRALEPHCTIDNDATTPGIR